MGYAGNVALASRVTSVPKVIFIGPAADCMAVFQSCWLFTVALRVTGAMDNPLNL